MIQNQILEGKKTNSDSNQIDNAAGGSNSTQKLSAALGPAARKVADPESSEKPSTLNLQQVLVPVSESNTLTP